VYLIRIEVRRNFHLKIRFIHRHVLALSFFCLEGTIYENVSVVKGLRE